MSSHAAAGKGTLTVQAEQKELPDDLVNIRQALKLLQAAVL